MSDHSVLTHELLEMIKAKAVGLGLTLCDGVVDLKSCPTVRYTATWEGFLDLAVALRATVLYIDEGRYDRDGLITHHLEQRRIAVEEEEGEFESEESREARRREDWFRTRARERITAWDDRIGQLSVLFMYCFCDGVAHGWVLGPEPWLEECRAALRQCLDEAEYAEDEQRRLRTREQAIRLHEYAEDMANHPRFAEASSGDKRLYMAEELFPDLPPDMDYHSIAERASLVYWWSVGPAEESTKAEKARELYRQGESQTNIAAILKMSAAKVKAAIFTAPE